MRRLPENEEEIFATQHALEAEIEQQHAEHEGCWRRLEKADEKTADFATGIALAVDSMALSHYDADPIDVLSLAQDIIWIRRYREEGIHSRDADCDVDPETELCRVCSVHHGEPCPECMGRGYHTSSCRAEEHEAAGHWERMIVYADGGAHYLLDAFVWSRDGSGSRFYMTAEQIEVWQAYSDEPRWLDTNPGRISVFDYQLVVNGRRSGPPQQITVDGETHTVWDVTNGTAWMAADEEEKS